MLKTALKPRWILALIGALVVATGFVLLSQWQFNRSETAPPPPASTTEQVVALTSHITPATDMMASSADQMVTATGSFLPGKQVLISSRIQDDKSGYWVVGSFLVDGAPDSNTIAVVRGWQPDESAPAPAPSGTIKLTGRLLPTEAPLARDLGQISYESLSVAELINIWDVPAYSAFIVAGPMTGANGVDVSAAATGLTQVDVGPQPQETQLNWLNIFYGIEWVVFAGFAVFLWYRLVADDYRRVREDIADAAALAAGIDPATVYGRAVARDTRAGSSDAASAQTEEPQVAEPETAKPHTAESQTEDSHTVESPTQMPLTEAPHTSPKDQS
ncbi:SURF1 family cytochrome oxidase biogenesis protein [Paeniglutamicibacter terrestris]|uniref:SURF1-like protein n=1 Tax=Paeniglutamicibacter terrestris TaxID=2723403 RepID=A0ABX1G288_9MICC|nr:SURF1 family protein [Paeniglutamicibacter terrestris]